MLKAFPHWAGAAIQISRARTWAQASNGSKHGNRTCAIIIYGCLKENLLSDGGRGVRMLVFLSICFLIINIYYKFFIPLFIPLDNFIFSYFISIQFRSLVSEISNRAEDSVIDCHATATTVNRWQQ